MTPETWSDVASWLMLAVGAAMAAGTGLALLKFQRDGVFPGQELDEHGVPVGEPAVRTAWAKVGIGLVLAVWGLAGLTTGSVPGLG